MLLASGNDWKIKKRRENLLYNILPSISFVASRITCGTAVFSFLLRFNITITSCSFEVMAFYGFKG